MGRTPKPLNILCIGIWGDEFVELADMGHTVDYDLATLPLTEYDVIFGPHCWRMTVDHMKYLPNSLSEARAARYAVQRPSEEANK